MCVGLPYSNLKILGEYLDLEYGLTVFCHFQGIWGKVLALKGAFFSVSPRSLGKKGKISNPAR